MSISFKSPLKVALVLAFGVLASCSSDKSPPDDGGDGQKAESTKALACAGDSEAFASCALGVLRNSGLTAQERASLSNCNFKNANAKSSGEDLFEAARSAVGAHCY